MRDPVAPRLRVIRSTLVAVAGSLLVASPLWGAEEKASTLDVLRQLSGMDPEGIPVTVRVLVLVTVFSIVPSIVLLTTCFPRILIILSFLRRALGAQDLLPNHVVTALAFILTAMVMMPVWTEVYDKAYRPLRDGRLKSLDEAIVIAEKPLKRFMFRYTREKDLLLIDELSRARETQETSATAASAAPGSSSAGARTSGPVRRSAGADPVVEDLSFAVVLPAFVMSELKTAFQMGFLLYLPFLMIDLMVSAVLLSMGMFMLPPVLVSLPLKVLVFVLVDGWNLVAVQLVQGFL